MDREHADFGKALAVHVGYKGHPWRAILVSNSQVTLIDLISEKIIIIQEGWVDNSR